MTIKRGVAFSYNNIGRIYDKQGDYGTALDYQLKSLELFKELGLEDRVVNIHYNIGSIYYRSGDTLNAMKYLELSLSGSIGIGESLTAGFSLIGIGNVYRLRNEEGKALDYLLQGLKIAQEFESSDGLMAALEGLYLANKKKGETGKALDYYERLVKVRGEIAKEENSRKMAGLQFGFELEKKQKEVASERAQREIVEEKNTIIEKERKKSDILLKNILPDEVAEALKENGKADARLFEDVTVLFTDFKGFTNVSEKLTPQELVNELHECFKAFDEITSKYNIEKIKTVGDAYLAASGLPTANPNHALDIVKAAFEIRDFILNRKEELIKLHREYFEVRIGIHTGHVVAGIVGIKKFAYDIWGDTVNTAARMEQNCEAGKINLSESTYQLVKDYFKCEYRGEIEAKNKGKLKMYFVEHSVM